MKQKTCKVAKTVLTLLLCAGLTAGSVPIDALAADVQSEQPVGGTETDTEAGTEGNTQSTGSVSDGNVVIKEREETGTESGAPQADSVSEGDGIALISLEAYTYCNLYRKNSGRNHMGCRCDGRYFQQVVQRGYGKGGGRNQLYG